MKNKHLKNLKTHPEKTDLLRQPNFLPNEFCRLQLLSLIRLQVLSIAELMVLITVTKYRFDERH